MSLESVKATVVEISASINAFHTAQSSSYQNDLALFRTIAAADCDSLPIIRPADSWTVQNTLLNTYLHDFRSQVLIIGNTCVKMALLINNLSRDKLDGPEARSIFTELDGHLRTLFSIFSRCAECALSHALHDTVVRGIASLFNLIGELVESIIAGQEKETIENVAGMVLQLSEDLQKMPITNKIAFRRLIMEKCLAVKETVTEFQGYLDEREANCSFKDINIELADEPENGGDDDENDEGDEEDERDYTEEEAKVVQKCVQVMMIAQELMKLSLSVVTSIGDAVLTGTDTSVYPACFGHLARIIQAVEVIETDITELGIELYPPVEIIDLSQDSIPNSSPLSKAYYQAMQSVRKLYSLLRNPQWSSHLSAELQEKLTGIDSMVTLL